MENELQSYQISEQIKKIDKLEIEIEMLKKEIADYKIIKTMFYVIISSATAIIVGAIFSQIFISK